jgi:hypothetical protein
MTAETLTDPTSLVDTAWPLDPVDDFFGEPFIDADEWREAPVRHRYIHGGFRGTDALFSYYFPEAGAYEGRFFQHVTPVPQSEHLAPLVEGEHNKIAFAASSGAYFVETNGGGPAAAEPFSGLDPTIGAYRVSAAAARFSRVVAQAVFGDHRPYGYLYGGSGGAYRTIGSSENTDGVWDGYVPYVPGSPMSIPNVFSVRMHAQRILRDKFPAIVDAYDAGGDPASLDLTDEERAALAEVGRMGFPPRSWFGWKTMGMHAFSVLYPGVMAADPTYADDFWTVDGYLGADAAASVHRDRVQLATVIAELIGETSTVGDDLVAGGVDESFLHTSSVDRAVAAVRLADAPEGWMLGAQLRVLSGASAGSVLQILALDGDGDIAHLEPGQEGATARLAAGDEVVLDNSSFLAAQTYHRHQVPGPEYAVWDQFRGDDGEPLCPQRPMLLGPLFTQAAAGTVPTGRIRGKMIAVACLLDREAFPWQADWYRARVEEHLGDGADEGFRLWFVDNALHGDDDPQEFPTRTVSYLGVLEVALRQLAAWVEDGVAPSPTSTYDVVDGQVLLTGAGNGVQPSVAVCVDGGVSTIVRVGEPVTIRVEATSGSGVIVDLTADLDGTGTLDVRLGVEPASRVVVETERVFPGPGDYLIAVRATAHISGGSHTPASVDNLARARVTVTA